MKITIEKKISWKTIYCVVLNDEKEIVRKEKLHWKNNLTDLEFDETNEKFIYFTNGNKNTEIIALSPLLSKLEILYNHKTRKYTCWFSIVNHDDYGTIRSLKIRDEDNLHFRRDKSKIINIWTPSDFNKDEEYGLILFFDSQNIFDIQKFGEYTKKYDPYGGWQIESTLENVSKLYNKKYIIVGIDNSDKYRMHELMDNAENLKPRDEILKSDLGLPAKFFKKANIKSFGNFIVDTVLPLVFEMYKIKKDDVGICGSSAGGMASLYLGLKYSNIFSSIFTFTPAIGLYTDESTTAFYKEFLQKDFPQPEIFFFQGVNGDLEKMLFLANFNLIKNLISAGYDPKLIHSYIENSAEHNEDAWRFAFNYLMDLKCK